MTTFTNFVRGAFVLLGFAPAGIALAQSTNPYYDDTDVFFNQFQVPTVTADPNILFILDTGSTMNEKLGGSTDPNAPTRLWVMKNSLLTVLQGLVDRGVQVNVGLMRMGVNGQSGSSGAAKGGFVVRPVQRLTQAVVDDWRRVLCMNNKLAALPVDTAGCEVIGKNGSNDPANAVPIFATPQQADMGSAASPITEMLAEARLYYEGGTPQWGQNALVGPGFDFPQNVIDRPALNYAGRNCGNVRNCTILPDTLLVKAPNDCSGNSNACKYNSPAKAGCQSNFIIMLSNGVFSVDTNNDNNAPNRITRWNGFLPYLGENTTDQGATSCSNNPYTTVYDAAYIPGGKKISVCPDDATYNMRQVAFNYSAIDYSNPSVPRSVSGRTNVVTYVVGFDLNSSLGNNPAGTSAARTHLETIARAGGTDVLTPNSEAELTNAFSGIIQQIVISNASFSSPSVAVNAFNQLQNLNELYFAVFAPRPTSRWNGNVKKYKLDPLTGEILDVNNQNAVQNGFFRGSAQSLWSVTRNARPMPDGFNATAGGAASKLPDVSTSIGARNVLTNANGVTGSLTALSSLKTATSVTNKLGTSVTPDQLLGTTCTPPTPSAAFNPPPADPICPTRDQLIDWAYGRDVACQVLPNNLNPAVTVRNPNGTTTTYPTACNPTRTRWDMGDPLHGKPAVVTYRATSTTNPTTGAITRSLTQYLFVVTNDGYLHAIDTETGEEKWSFMPWDLVDRLMLLYKDDPINPRRSLGLDSPVKVLRIDRNNDNFIDPSTRNGSNLNDLSTGDHVYLYFGMRRGGRNMYAIDVTDIDNPRLVWRISPDGTDSSVAGVTKSATDFATLGYTWSSPQLTRIRVPGKTSTLNPAHFALVFGGGYDSTSQDGVTPKGYVQDNIGNGIYIVDAASGRLLWRAGRDAGADMQFAANCPGSGSSSSNCMSSAFPGDVRAVALSSLDAADLLYAADLGGRIWRFQINKNATQFSDLMVGGGVVAYVGGAAGDANGLLPENARRFFAAPDISWITLPSGALSLNIAIGSGNRELPTKDTVTVDRFYSLREPYPINWGSNTVLTDADFYDLRNAPTNTTPLSYPGWKLTLFQSGDAQNGAGAKVLAEARTFENTLFFTSFVPIPNPLIASNLCTQQLGINNLYQVNVFDGQSKVYNPRNLPTTGDGRAVTLNQGGIAPEVQFVFPTNPVNNLGQPIGPPPKPICLAGAESCGQFSGYEPTRTYWRQDGAD